MKKISKKVIAFLLCVAIMLSFTSCFTSNPDNNQNNNQNNQNNNQNNKGDTDVSEYLIGESETPFRIHYYEETPFINDNSSAAFGETGKNVSWENWSLPIGNGYFGVNVFGRTETERVQIADKTLENAWQANIPEENWPQTGGLNNFAETYLDIGHKNSDVTDYYRYLDLNTATSGVSYIYDDVEYTREYFTSYPDKALVIRLDASEDGQIDFVLRPVVPYEQEYMTNPKDGFGKYGEVVSSVSNGVGRIELTGKMTYYDVDFVGYYEVYTDGGTVSATTCTNSYGDTDGTITVSGANSAYIVVTLGSDYELNSLTFYSGQHEQNKPTKNTTLEDAKRKVNGYLDAIHNGINGKNYEDAYSYLRGRHLEDYQELFGRVSVDLDYNEADFDLSTDKLLEKYKSGQESTYFEALLLQYGRYLLISSSREGTLPAHLQGAWNVYNSPAWSSGYWNNINVQMNYWHAFSTNISETFVSYVDFMKTYMAAAKSNASNVILQYNPTVYNQDGGNGWTLGTCSNAYFIQTDRNCGNLGFITQLYWDYYQFTKDPEILDMVYDILLDAARFITKCVKEYDGKYLVEHSDSPEMFVDGVWYYTQGTTYAQTFAYLNNYYVLELAKELGIDITDSNVLSQSDKTILKTILNQLNKYDPINVGLSGQVKEFRQEDYYGSIGYETTHRHISQLVGLYPGNLINADTQAWMDAALVSLNGRLEGLDPWDQAYTVGWSWAHKAAMFARLGMGDEAQEMLLGLSKGATLENLLMVCFTVFQIEASCGTSAALTEMLLQSQNGYVEPLPALASDWQNGSYTGLVARGNFEVSAAWENGVATSFNILSNKGERLTVKYPSITSASVYTKNGFAVDYEVVGQDMIAFDTVEGETYVIYDLKEVVTPDKVTNFNYEVVSSGNYAFTWDKVENATGYNVYVAFENDANYTFVANAKTNSFVLNVPAGKENVRKTFAVTAVNAEGRESRRALTYYNPVETNGESSLIENVFEGKQFVPSAATANMQYNAGLGFHCLTDGEHYREGDGRFSTTYDGYVDATLTLGGIYKLNEIRFYVFQRNLDQCGASIKVDVCYNGVWTTVKEITRAQYSQYLKNDDYGQFCDTVGSGQYISIDLGNAMAEKVRIYVAGGVGTKFVTFYEVECSGEFVGESVVTENVFSGNQFVPTTEAQSYVLTGSGFQLGGYEALTDGIITEDQIGRLSTQMNINAMMDATIDLGGAYELYDLVFYIYDGWQGPRTDAAGKDLLVQVYYNGQWIDVINCVDNAAIAAHHVHPSNEWRDDYLLFKLDGVKAEKVRFYISGAASNDGITFHEITCSGTKVK